MPHYYKINLKDFNSVYFASLLNFLNKCDKTLNAVLMEGKEDYQIFTNRPLNSKEKGVLYLCSHELKDIQEELYNKVSVYFFVIQMMRSVIRDVLAIYVCYKVLAVALFAQEFSSLALVATAALLFLTVWFLLEKIGILPKATG